MTLALVVEFSIHSENVEAFEREILKNAQLSVELEPGCQQFDVCADPADASRFFLYERYDDQAAIDAHLAAEHFKRFDAVSKDWVQSKSVRCLKVK